MGIVQDGLTGAMGGENVVIPNNVKSASIAMID